MYDYEKSKSRLSRRVSQIHKSDWSPTHEANALDALAQQINNLVLELSKDKWLYLEDAFNTSSPENTFSGDRSGMYAGLCWRLRELSDLAGREKAALPNPRYRRGLRLAAEGLLHIMYQCGHPRPTKYEHGDGVKELKEVCDAAGMCLSNESLRGALGKALDRFDPADISDEILEFLQEKQ